MDCFIYYYFFTVYDLHGNTVLTEIVTEKVCQLNNITGYLDLRYFYYKHTKYVWDSENYLFSTLDILTTPQTVDDHLHNTDGLRQDEYLSR